MLAITLWLLSIAFNGIIATIQLKIDIPMTINHYGRMTAFTEHVSDLGAMCSIAFIPALIMAQTFKKVRVYFSIF